MGFTIPSLKIMYLTVYIMQLLSRCILLYSTDPRYIQSDLSPQGTGYTTIVRNNIIVNTQKRTKDPDGTGYAVINYLPETHTFVLENNCLYNNVAGNYQNCTSTTDIYVDPLFVNQSKHDYHLKPNSPCIGAGYTFIRFFKRVWRKW